MNKLVLPGRNRKPAGVLILLLSAALMKCAVLQAQAKGLPPAAAESGELITLADCRPGRICGAAHRLQPRKARGGNIFGAKGAKFILPAVFMAYGTASRFNELPVRRWDTGMADHMRGYAGKHFPVDNYLEAAPPVLAFGLDFIPGIESRHNLRDRALIMATSYLVMNAMTGTLKKTVPVERPRGWMDDSFPSGHTAVSMTGAHIMFREYKDVSPWIGISGYLMAAGTGYFRMYNKAHWLSDVVMSAGIGLLSAEIGYMMLPLWHSLFGIKDGGRAFSAVPAIGIRHCGLALAYQF
jgi:hypothetical protein